MNDPYGQLEQVGDRWRLRFTRRLPHPPEKVWRALSEPDHLAAWFPTTVEGDRVEGAKLKFGFPFPGAEPIDGEMLAYRPYTLMELRWGEDNLCFELASSGAATVLTLTVTFLEEGRGARDAAGWHVCLDSLAADLADREPDTSGAAWRPVHADYVRLLGPGASTIGPPDWHPESAPE
jgi:uncharacterized protein YndB with AHSA1/START domain